MLLLNSSGYQIISWTLDPVVIAAIVALLGTVISGLISFKVARHTASQEIQKLEITWREACRQRKPIARLTGKLPIQRKRINSFRR